MKQHSILSEGVDSLSVSSGGCGARGLDSTHSTPHGERTKKEHIMCSKKDTRLRVGIIFSDSTA